MADEMVFAMEKDDDNEEEDDDEEYKEKLGRRLINAAHKQDTDRISILIDKGVDIDFRDEEDQNAFLILSEKGEISIDIFYELVSSSSVIVRDQHGSNVFEFAMIHEFQEYLVVRILKKLVEEMGNSAHEHANDEFMDPNPLQMAVSRSMSQVAFMLIEMGVSTDSLGESDVNKLKELVFEDVVRQGAEKLLPDTVDEESDEDDKSESDENESEEDDSEEDDSEDIEVIDVHSDEESD